MEKQPPTWTAVNVIVLIDRQEEVTGVPDTPRLLGRRPLCHWGVLR
jgi:hypothetical protein